jgi:hypothetical protein
LDFILSFVLGSCYKNIQYLEKALLVYQSAHDRYPSNQDVLKYLVATAKELDKVDLEGEYERKLAALKIDGFLFLYFIYFFLVILFSIF